MKMIKQKIFCKILCLLMLANFFCFKNFPKVRAENQAAKIYRQLFESEIFFLKIKDKWGRRILASDGEIRVERMNTSIGNLAYLNPLGTLFSGGEDKFPEFMSKDGNYYQFIEDNQAFVCTQKDLQNENLDPRQSWNTVRQKLAIPDELSVFYKDPYALKSSLLGEPKFIKSFQTEFDKKIYDCDRYVREVKSASGQIGAKIIYDLFYLENKLVRAETSVERNGSEYPVHSIEIEAIQSDIPKNSFEFKKKITLLAAGTGDMSDLLEKPKHLGVLENLQLGGSE